MKKILLLIAVLFGGVIAGVIAGLLMPAEQREKLSRSLAAPIGRGLEQPFGRSTGHRPKGEGTNL